MDTKSLSKIGYGLYVLTTNYDNIDNDHHDYYNNYYHENFDYNHNHNHHHYDHDHYYNYYDNYNDHNSGCCKDR